MTEIEKAYLAGIIDGEGTITLVKDGEFRYPTLSFCNNVKAILDYVNSFCAGVITTKHSEKYANNYVWRIERRRAVEVLQEILPYMHETKKCLRGKSIVENYIQLTPRNGRYSTELRMAKHQWENDFFLL